VSARGTAAPAWYPSFKGGVECGQIIAVCQLLHIPAIGVETLRGVLALRLVGHGVERDVVGVVNEDQVVQLLVAGKFRGLMRDALLHAAIAGQADNVIVKNCVFRRVEPGGGHLLRDGEADRIRDALAERSCGGLDARGVAKLRVARRPALKLAEVLHRIQREIKPGEMQPGVEEHAAVASGEDEAVAIEPARLVGIQVKRVAEEHRSDFRATEGQT